MKALIVVDVQNDFCEGGNLAVTGGNSVAEAVAELIESDDYKVIAFTQDWHIEPGNHFALFKKPDFVTDWPVHCVAGTEGANLHPKVREAKLTRFRRQLHGDELITDHFRKGQYSASYSGFDGKNPEGVPMEIWLKQHRVDVVDIVGLALDYCVAATAADAVGMGFVTTVLHSYTAAVSPEANTVSDLKAAGVNIAVGS